MTLVTYDNGERSLVRNSGCRTTLTQPHQRHSHSPIPHHAAAEEIGDAIIDVAFWEIQAFRNREGNVLDRRETTEILRFESNASCSRQKQKGQLNNTHLVVTVIVLCVRFCHGGYYRLSLRLQQYLDGVLVTSSCTSLLLLPCSICVNSLFFFPCFLFPR